MFLTSGTEIKLLIASPALPPISFFSDSDFYGSSENAKLISTSEPKLKGSPKGYQLDDKNDEGFILSRKIALPSAEMKVSFHAPHGKVYVELVDEAGSRLRDATPLSGSYKIDSSLEWQDENINNLVGKKIFVKLKNGRLKPERKLDLHGSTYEKARSQVIEFIKSNNYSETVFSEKSKLVEIPICYDEEFALDIKRLEELASKKSYDIDLMKSMSQAASIMGFSPHFPKNGEYASALGALLVAEKNPSD